MTSILPALLRQVGASGFCKVLIGSLALAAVANAAVASAASAAQQPDASGAAIAIDNFAFAPAELTAPVGASITWTNAQPGVPHTTSSVDGVWDSGTLASGATFTFAFDQPGDFAYQCLIHPSMRGLVHIVDPAPTAPPATETVTVEAPVAQPTSTPTQAATSVPTPRPTIVPTLTIRVVPAVTIPTPTPTVGYGY